MIVPGSNLLNIAFSVITPSQFQYLQFTGRTNNSIGFDVSVYAAPVNAEGSVQPVPRNMYQQYGLDFQKNYANFYIASDIIDIARDVAGDQFIFENKYYEALSKTPWFGIDGWDAVLCVQVPAPTS